MSNLRVQGNATGTGTFTIAAPSGNTDRTLTLPDEAGTLLTTTGDGSGLTGISSYTDSDALSLFNATGSAPVYSCRAWVNFNGTGTVAIRASGNVSSITDIGTGGYEMNFSTAMPDVNYAFTTAGQRVSGASTHRLFLNQSRVVNLSTTKINLHSGDENGVGEDPTSFYVAVFR